MFYVYSTLTCDNAYNFFDKNVSPEAVVPVIERTIHIRGGANVANKNLVTPEGVVTEVTDEEMSALEENYHFKEHVKHGFITFSKREVKPEKAVQDMTKKDASAPKTPEDFKDREVAADGTLKAKKKN